MKKFVTVFLIAVTAALLCSAALADGAATYSDKAVKFIESFEGYSQMQYENPVGSGNYYIGYGSACQKDAYPEGITQADAEALLKNYLDSTAVTELNSFLSANSVTLSQQQYDALISLSYNMGGSWMTGGYRIGSYVKAGLSNYTDEQIVDAMGVISHQGSSIVEGLINRRIREAQILLYGDYTGQNCPQYSWLVVDRNGGTLENDVFCFAKDTAYGFLPEPTLEGMYFAGWSVKETGAILKASDTVNRNLHATATWSDKLVLPYTDVKSGDWYYDAVSYCYAQRLMSGTTTTTFAPGANMTRAMLVTVLWTMNGAPTVNYAMPFADVKDGEWYSEAIRWAASNNIVGGKSATSFDPKGYVTREQMVAILYKYAVMQGKNVDFDESQNLSAYADASSIAPYAQTQMLWAAQMGIIGGYTDQQGVKTIKPQNTATRAQVAQIIKNYTMT